MLPVIARTASFWLKTAPPPNPALLSVNVLAATVLVVSFWVQSAPPPKSAKFPVNVPWLSVSRASLLT